jgi:putative ABC transport system ATP-binding protein
MNNTPLIVAERLSRYYPDGKVHALINVSLTIDRGQYVAIVGPSGSGKSTLLNLLGGLDRPNGGYIVFDGARLESANLDSFRANKIGFVFQSFYLLPTLTAAENVQVPMFESRLAARARRSKALELLELVGMAQRATHLPNQLSVGERQRVALARSLANDPAVLLADEPTGNLDSHTADEILTLFDELHAERGMTIVMITHDPHAAAKAERTVHLCDGRIVD